MQELDWSTAHVSAGADQINHTAAVDEEKPSSHSLDHIIQLPD